MPQDDRPHRTQETRYSPDGVPIIISGWGSKHPDLERYPYGGEAPRDPAIAGFVGRAKPTVTGWPDPDGNRAERRAAAKAGHKRMYGGKGGTHRAGKHRRR